MKFALLAYSPENAWTPEEWSVCVNESIAICDELKAKQQFIAASPLKPVETATSVRVRQGQTQVTTGPFAETAEQLGGFFLIDAPSLDDAIAIAERLPSAQKGTVEVRPLFELDGLPTDQFHADVSMMGQGGFVYMLLCYDDEQAWQVAGPAALEAAMNQAVELTHRLHSRRQYISAAPLHSSSAATSVRRREGHRLVTDGPFAETREVLGGYYLIVARDLNDAISIAAQHPGAKLGTVEIRQIVAEAMQSLNN
jgi:hypothetical protein